MPEIIPAISFSARFFLRAGVELLAIPVVSMYLIHFPPNLGLMRHSPFITRPNERIYYHELQPL